MKRIKFNDILCVLVILCMLVSMASAAVPTDNQIQPCFIRITRLSTSFTVSASGYADCYGRVELDNLTDSAELTVELQRSSDQSNWETIKDWSASGKCAVELNKGWYVASGYYYRIHITADVYSTAGSLVDSATKDSVVAWH